MTSPVPASVGHALRELDTPCLTLDLDAFERNVDRLFESLRDFPGAVRPHAKSHKCPELARRLVAKGAVGICCQKVSEAEVFADHGIEDILVANEFVGEAKLRRYLGLARRVPRLACCVDDPRQAAALSAAAVQAGLVLQVLVEVDVGQGRCGVADAEAAVAMAMTVTGLPGLSFSGLQGYHGAAQHFRSADERAAAISAASAKMAQIRDALAQQGVVCKTITGAGTGSYLLEAASGVYNELQPGSFVFMDVDYRRNHLEGSPMPAFEQSLFVAATVMSQPTAQRAVVDAGLKAFSVDSGLPELVGVTGARYVKASDEHGVLEVDAGAVVALGDVVRIAPGHCDPTVNLYDHLVVLQEGLVKDIWPIAARGCLA
jgi:D-serine deaminase-like pyridoxal phosphate-dependent protein